ncbi:MAG: DUF4832 domain-containing protein [Treponema sp.]|nr:DUF4832 domain-containing protein [Treponema sp.]
MIWREEIMKKVLFFLSSVLLCFSCKTQDSSEKEIVQENTASVSFVCGELKDCNEVIFNPDMGFYSVIKVKVTQTGVQDKSEIISLIKEDSNPLKGDYPESDEALWDLSYNLLHLEFDISDYSKAVNGSSDIMELSEESLKGVREILSAFRGTEKTAVVRFAYDADFDGNKNTEPEDFSVILNHVKQISEIYSEYEDVITAVECGIIGPWGEMHSSKYAASVEIEGNIKPDYYIVQVMHEYLEGLKSADIPFLVRQPKFIYAYLNTYCDVDYNFKLDSNNESYPAAIPTYIPQYGSDEYKLGLYNDGYLGSESDSGTYKSSDRSAEIEFLSGFTDHTPYGGELIGNYGIGDGESVSVENFTNVHASFLNIGWNRNFFYQFNDLIYSGESLFQYLYKHLGYRYLLKDAVFTQKDGLKSVQMDFTFENTGFASLPYHRKKNVQLFFIPSESAVSGNEEPLNIASELFTGQKVLTVTADLSSLDSGSYAVYVKFSDSDGTHVIRPANTGWNSQLKAVKAGVCTLKASETN